MFAKLSGLEEEYMAFFEKLSAMAKAASSKASVLAKDASAKASELAKNAADKANTAIEVGKLNSQIRNERDNISMTKNQIGHLVWERFSAGETLDPALQELCKKIVLSLGNIDVLNGQIEELKAKGEEVVVEDQTEEADDGIVAEIKEEAAEIFAEIKEEAAEMKEEAAELVEDVKEKAAEVIEDVKDTFDGQ
jgi:chromosome segregation ATPase